MQTLKKTTEKNGDVSVAGDSELWPDFGRMRDMMESMWQRPWHLPNFHGSQMSVNMFRDGKMLSVEANLPGVEKADISIKVESLTLTIEADHREETTRDEKEHFFREIRRQKFFRRIPLPMEVDEQAAKASFQEGVLRLKLPIMKPDAATPKTIEVE